MPGPKDVNMSDVARAAGVSTATVSRALRDVPGVSAGTRARIRQIAEDFAYVVSPDASRLSGRGTGRVALVVPRIDVWFYSTMLAGIESVMQQHDIDVLVYQVDGREQRRRFFQDLPARRKVDAVVLIALPVLADEEHRLDLLGVEVVVAGGRLRDWTHVRVDDHLVGLTAVRHLVEIGHRRIAMIRTEDTDGTRWSSDVERVRGYRDALDQAGVRFRDDYLVSRPFGTRAGVEGAEALLALPEPPTAVFAYSDEIAFGVLQHLHQRGLSAPRDLSVVGVDDHPLSGLFGLTTVSQSVDIQAHRVGAVIIGLLRDGHHGRQSVVYEPTLVRRTSTAPPG